LEIKVDDIVYELSNIGSAHAANSLSKMLGTRVNITVPEVTLESIDDIPTRIGIEKLEKINVVTRFYYHEFDHKEDRGIILVLMDEDNGNLLSEQLMGMKIEDFQNMDDDTKSLFSEVGNIMVGAYISSISNFLQNKINMSIPEVAVDYLGSLIDSTIAEISQLTSYIFFIKNKLMMSNNEVEISIIVFFDESLIKAIKDIY